MLFSDCIMRLVVAGSLYYNTVPIYMNFVTVLLLSAPGGHFLFFPIFPTEVVRSAIHL